MPNGAKMKILKNGKLYDNANPKWVVIAEYTNGEEKHIVYRATDGNFIEYTRTVLKTDVPTPPVENLTVLSEQRAYEVLNNFRGTVDYGKFEEA